MRLTIRKGLVSSAVGALALASSVMVAPPASAHGWCWSGTRYGGAGTTSNYVEFQVNASATGWHVHSPWWGYPAQLWAVPDGRGMARAGIWGTDWSPPYSPSNYKLCTG